MWQRDSHCPYLQSSELTASGTVLALIAGKEDPLKYYSSLHLWGCTGGVGYGGVRRLASVKHPNLGSNLTKAQGGGAAMHHLLTRAAVHSVAGPALTHAGGEFGWGGTLVKSQRQCPMTCSEWTETTRRPKGEKHVLDAWHSVSASATKIGPIDPL